MRIGILFEYSSMNGGEHSILNMIDCLKGSDCHFEVLAPPTGQLADEVRCRELSFTEFQLRDVSGARKTSAELASELAALVQRLRLDLLHANSLAMGRHLGGIADKLSVPTTSHLRDIISLKQKVVADLNRHQKLIAVSQATCQFHFNQGMDQERLVTVYNGVDSDRFQPRTGLGVLRRQLGISEEAFLVVTIGQICLRKGQVCLPEVAKLTQGDQRPFHFLLAGERHSTKQESIEFDEKITRDFEAYGLANRLHRLGYVQDVARLLNEADVLLHPARQEPLGRVLLEAAASGTPIVATNVGGTPEILEHDKSALLVAPDDVSGIAASLSRLVNDSQLSEQLAQAARTNVMSRFTPAVQARKLFEIWEAVIQAGF